MAFVSDYQSQYNAWLAKTDPSPLLQGFTLPATSGDYRPATDTNPSEAETTAKDAPHSYAPGGR